MFFTVLSLLVNLVLAVSYDYVVCGGGTAGTALAVRLAQGSNCSVLLIEAGTYPDADPALSVPAAALVNQGDSFDWRFYTVPANGIPAFEYTRGKVLGGSSQYNYLTYTRGPAAYYDYLATYLDDDTWSWNETFPYFQKSLNVTPPINHSAINAPQIYNARDGPLQVNYALPQLNVFAIESESFDDVRDLHSIDFNDGKVIGYSEQGATISPETGLRSSSWASFGVLGQTLSNFHVLTNSMVLKVNFANSTGGIAKSVTSVFYLDLATNRTHDVKVNKEAILSGGFIQSPQMLQLSGVGPNDVLEELNIPLEIELPEVGQNLQDHLLILGMASVLENVTTGNDIVGAANSSTFASLQAYGARSRYATLYGGPIAFEHISGDIDTTPSTQWPNQEWIGNSPVNLSMTSPANEVLPAIVCIAPTSKGNISLVSNDALDKPLLYTNYLGTSEDQQFAIDSYRRLQEMIHSPPWSYNLAPNSPTYNSSMSDAEVFAAIARSSAILYHGCCTAAAGPDNKTGVVNSKLMVHGTTNLRVVDTSVLPRIVPAHTQAIVYMIAEKAADDILAGIVA